jgi:transposase
VKINMSRKTVQVDRNQQFDFLEDTPAYSAPKKLTASASGRKFIAPDRHQIYLGMTRLDQYLEQAGLTAPLAIASLLDEQDWSEFESRYAPTGRAPYAPRAMMGLILFGIMQGTDSLRNLERLARQDLGCLWVTGGICPDHACIGRFITLHEDAISHGFFESLTRTVLKVTGSDSHHLAGDGTVIEAACSHYKLLKEEAVKQQTETARAALQEAPDDKKCQQQAALAIQVEETYEARKQARLGKGAKTDSLAVSPTEPEAMVQPQKRKRGKAASYKSSVLANEQRVIVAHDVDPSQEISVIPGLLDQGQRVTGEEAKELSLDAGYFCNTVIDETLRREISLLCPEGKGLGNERKVKGGVFPKSQFHYLPLEDVYVCPAGERLQPGPKRAKKYTMYRTSACSSCVLKDQCTKAKEGRRIRRLDGDEAKEALRDVMQHRQAQKVFRQRQAMVEPVFSVLKQLQGLNRFRRRGLAGVKREFALHVLAYNLSRAVIALYCTVISQYRAFWRVIKGDLRDLMNRQRFQLWGPSHACAAAPF